MPVDSSDYGRYANPGGRPVENMGHTTPDVELSDSQRPAVPFKPAPFLPASRFDEHKRANIVLSAGTPVSLDAAGNLVPAGTPVGHAFDYSTLDVRTGLAAVKRADTGANVTAATDGVIMASGLGGDRTAHVLECVGVVSYNAYQFEGAVEGTWPAYTTDYDNPSKFPIHNSQAQPETLVAITCDYALEVPYIWGRNLLSDTVKIFDNDSDEVAVLSANAKSYPFAHDELVVGTLGSSVLTSGVGASVASGLAVTFVSPQCGLSDTGCSGLATIAGGAAAATFAAPGGSAGTAVDLTVAGDHILRDGGDNQKYIIIRSPGGPITDPSGTLSLDCADQLQPGDFVAARLGKFVKFDATRMSACDKVGQVLRVRTNAIKRDYMDRVKTAYDRSADPTHRMAGSATRGVPYLISLVSDAAQVVLETKKQLDGTAISATGLPSSLPLGSVVINLLR